MHFTGEMRVNMKKTDFLTNLDNKQRFLETLVIKMNEGNYKPFNRMVMQMF